jgi:hypothetical protein
MISLGIGNMHMYRWHYWDSQYILEIFDGLSFDFFVGFNGYSEVYEFI